MVRVITVDDLRNLIRKVTLKTFMLRLIDRLERDFARWQDFDLAPRLASHYPHGVIELMPISDKDYYAYKYVNGHPGNPLDNKQTVVAVGMLADVASGYPLLISGMTKLTAIRTAATSVVASKYLAPKNATTFGIIGTGAQSEFQTLAHHFALGIKEIYYYDLDPKAMAKFDNNMQSFGVTLHPCIDAKSVVERSEIVTTATADKSHAKVVHNDWIDKGIHINGIGGDCPGKTELDPALIARSKIVVELLAQSELEGEIQHIDKKDVYAELWELVLGKKPGRESADEVTLYDSVGFALEDYSVLRLVHSMAEDYHIGHVLDMVPDTNDPKDLFSLLH